MTKVVDTPYFVDQGTDGHPTRRFGGDQALPRSRTLPQSPQLTSIARHYRTIESKTRDLNTPEGYPLHGIYFMSEHLHYFDTENEVPDGEHP